jgi:hypothetical protein
MLFAASGKAVAAAALLRINFRRVHFLSIDMLSPLASWHGIPWPSWRATCVALY